jgi:hypothetical protein
MNARALKKSKTGFRVHKTEGRSCGKSLPEDGPNVLLSNEEPCFSDISKQIAGIRLPDIISVVV